MAANTMRANYMRGNWKTVVIGHKCNETVQRLVFNLETSCVFTHIPNWVLASEFLFWLDFRSYLGSDNKTKPAMLWDCVITFAVYVWRVAR